MLTDRRWREFFQVCRAGLALRKQGWLAAALDLERTIPLPRQRLPTLVQGLFLSGGRRFLSMSGRPPGRVRRIAEALGYSRLEGRPDGRWRRFTTLRRADDEPRSFIRALKGDPPRLPPRPPPPLKRPRQSPRAVDRLIHTVLEDAPLGGDHCWQPTYLAYRFTGRIRRLGLTWQAHVDVLFNAADGADFWLWVQTRHPLRPAEWKLIERSPALGEWKRELTGLGIASGPTYRQDRRVAYLSASRRAGSLKALLKEASTLGRWLRGPTSPR